MHTFTLQTFTGQVSGLASNGYGVTDVILETSQYIVVCLCIVNIHTTITTTCVVDSVANCLPDSLVADPVYMNRGGTLLNYRYVQNWLGSYEGGEYLLLEFLHDSC